MKHLRKHSHPSSVCAFSPRAIGTGLPLPLGKGFPSVTNIIGAFPAIPSPFSPTEAPRDNGPTLDSPPYVVTDADWDALAAAIGFR